MKKKIMIGLIIYAAGFLLFFLIKFAAGFFTIDSTPVLRAYNQYAPGGYAQQNEEMNVSEISVRKNYASYKMEKSLPAPSQGTRTVSVEQKYEKVATLSAQSREFDKSEAELRGTVTQYNAVIQYEQNSGLKGSRSLVMTVGVIPEQFDAMVESLKKIGLLRFLQIDKSDKTSEYKEMQAKLKTIENSRNALQSLRGQGGTIADLVALQTKIMELENQAQALGVKLGDFSEENEFCTIRFTLSENLRLVVKIPLLTRLITALEWTVKFYGVLTVMFFLAMAGIALLAWFLGRMGWVKNLIAKYQ